MSPCRCDPFVADLSQVRVGVDRGTVARQNFIAMGAFAKQNFFLIADAIPAPTVALDIFVIATFERRTRFSRTKFPQTQFCLVFNNEAASYPKNNGIGCTARFNLDGSVWSAFDESFH
jgi:hypothetical protein